MDTYGKSIMALALASVAMSFFEKEKLKSEPSEMQKLKDEMMKTL